MTDYSELVKALRRCDMKQGCFNANCRYSVGKYFCDMDKVHKDAAAAIEDLQRELSLAEIAADDNGRQVEELQGELSEANTTVKAFKMEIEKLQAEVKILKVSGREAYFEGMAADAEPKRGEWIETEEMEWGIYPFKKKTCSVCDCKIDHTFMLACMDYFDDRDTVFHYCPNCGAKMEVQDG